MVAICVNKGKKHSHVVCPSGEILVFKDEQRNIQKYY